MSGNGGGKETRRNMRRGDPTWRGKNKQAICMYNTKTYN